MAWCYRKCKKCGNLMPYLTYSLSKKENAKLTEKDKEICHRCYLNKYPKRHPELLRDYQKIEAK